MSREVRRVPVGWRHPTEFNPYWAIQSEMSARRGATGSKLHGPTERFVPLYGRQVSQAQAEWDAEKAQWDNGTHSGFAFQLNYHGPEGYLNTDGTRDEPKRYAKYDEDGNTVLSEHFFSTIADVQEHYPFEDEAGSRPTADRYFPDFGIPDDQLGWCLYETVSEGTPVTPVFATAAELIEHLCTEGQDWDQQPMRRASAERIVSDGGTVGSMVAVGGTVYRSDVDADLIAERLA